MVFSSMVFLCVFLPAVFLLYRVIPSLKARNVLLVAASLLFYAYGEPVYILLMLFSILANWAFGLLVCGRQKKLWITVAVVINIGLLFWFKYLDMALEGINFVFRTNLPLVHLALPVGISFFTFQALSYVIDVYRGEAQPQKNLLNVMFYISFFPQLIAGPIVKYHDIAEQISHRSITPEKTAEGWRRFCIGLGKKVLLANTMAVAADAAYAAGTAELSAALCWTGALAYCFQIYLDFSGYSDMAIGMGKLFGFHFLENFNYPYISVSMQDFWKRWHISLTSWFTQYVYIPLGGNRKGKIRTAFNKFMVFLFSGLWHGANLTFVLWGCWNGLLVLLEDWIPVRKAPRWLGHIYTIIAFTIGFAMFRAETVVQGFEWIGIMFTGFEMNTLQIQAFLRILNPLFVCIFVFCILACTPFGHRLAKKMDSCGTLQSSLVYAASLGVLVLSILSLSSGTYNPFIYFRF